MIDFNYKVADYQHKVNIFENIQVNLIDFGFATRFKDKKTKKHYN